MPKELKAHEKDAIAFQLSALLEYDEPRAFLATLQRMAERKAFSCSQADEFDAARSWQALADALTIARNALEASHKAAKPARAHVTEF